MVIVMVMKMEISQREGRMSRDWRRVRGGCLREGRVPQRTITYYGICIETRLYCGACTARTIRLGYYYAYFVPVRVGDLFYFIISIGIFDRVQYELGGDNWDK